MKAHKILKYPGIVVALLLVYLYFNPPEAVKKRRQLFSGTPCIAGLVKLERKIPDNWKIECLENNLKVSITLSLPSDFNEISKKRAYFFREMANSLVFISKNTPEANLENVASIHTTLSSGDFIVESLTKGSDLVKLKTLTSPDIIMEHLKNTVQVKETVK